ncbi:unnamed protein product [Callosobruchus maculatus]|uniref:Uncharacterized protein n=1 Tax=Callosobruchus maculatus TaxID=64391 RepID=A0A653CWS2_CALMS|nr:unnamed protein product [Callosobruchus maculatus]VEN52202.1 unnamed protein product [Callosobruchus maculatus]
MKTIKHLRTKDLRLKVYPYVLIKNHSSKIHQQKVADPDLEG